MTEQQGYLTIRQVTARLHTAGYNDSQQTVRRLIDAGHLGTEGADWYRTERGGYRMVSPAAVDRLVAKRKTASTPPAE
ncbi:hypothetical protein [Micromonospora polyrhachis]|uniref:Uncharacterized protein n=1 Tax=Micromonospora polyrhachis TaxID=1282883 RepID=A0A7W7SQA9_9ACTN|nr:hypothetical protein [Micromonospora polyrhachis]MBB4958975.1 hypothetical protein [Micromonospora polyrhachis]